MKLSKKLLLLVSILLALCSSAYAFDKVTIDKIVYELIPKNTSFPNEDGSETKILVDLARIVESKRPANSPDFATFRIPTEIDVDGKIYPVGWINKKAFYGCAIEKLIIPSEIFIINKDAFAFCTRLKEVILEGGKNSIVIKPYAFVGTNIERVNLDRNIVEFYDSESSSSDQSLFGTKVKQLEIGSNVTYIPVACFWDCQSLTSVTIPGTVQELGVNAFGRTNLKEVVYEAGDTPLISGDLGAHSIEHLTLNRNFKSGNFGGCNINEIEIGPDVTRISGGLFYNCTNLESIKIPGTVKSIGVSAFQNCENLSEVIFEEGIEKIEKWAFRDCDKLESITLPEGLIMIDGIFNNCDNLKLVNLPSSLQTIGEFTFFNCKKMTTVSIPPSVRYIGKYAFYNVPLTSMYIEDSRTALTMNEVFTEYFEGEKLPTEIETFHLGRNVVFKSSDNNLNMLSECHLKNFTMSPNLTVIPEYFFSDWTEDTWPGLTSFKLPEGVTELSKKCFENCTGLKELILPPAVKKIAINAFTDSSLERLMVMSPEPPQCSSFAFDDEHYADVELVVPTESFELYRTTTPWSKFQHVNGSYFDSIESVKVTDEAPAEWYDLKGMKVNGKDMPAGIYLRRQGAKVEKVVVH